jgi:Fe-S cluster assembly protein SufD
LLGFNAAWFSDGVYIDIAAGYRLAQPIQIINVVSVVDALAATRNLIILHKQAEAEVIESFIGNVDSYFSSVVNECFIEDNAQLSLYKLQSEAEQAVHISTNSIKQQPYSRFKHHNFALGGLVARTDIVCDLLTASECDLNGLFLGRQRQVTDTQTRINHLKPHGISREYYKGVLDQRARGIFQGRVTVAQAADKTDSQMQNRNLLLSAEAEVDSKPQLEIYADDVKCSHGLTVGQLDEQAIYFLQARGLDEAAARNILTFAFANEMVDKVENAELKALLNAQLLRHFPDVKLD